MSKAESITTIPAYDPTVYVNNTEPDLDEAHLNKTEQAIKRVTAAANEAIAALKELNTAKISTSQIVNNLLATDPGTVLAAPMGKNLSDKYADLLNKYAQLNSELGILKTIETIPLKPDYIVSGGLMDASYIARVGPVKMLKLTTQFMTTIPGVTTFYTLPDGYRPTSIVKLIITTVLPGTPSNTISIYPDGRVNSDSELVANFWYFIYAVFI